MEIDEAMAQLAEKLDSFIDRFFGLLDSKDETAQRDALRDGFTFVKEFDRLVAESLNTLKSLPERQSTMPAEQRAATLIKGYEFGLKLEATLHDEFGDVATGNKVTMLTKAIRDEVDKIDPEHAAFVALLDHADDDIRVGAAGHLIKWMPDRVVPILQAIEERNRGLSAGFAAHWRLLVWEREGKGSSSS